MDGPARSFLWQRAFAVARFPGHGEQPAQYGITYRGIQGASGAACPVTPAQAPGRFQSDSTDMGPVEMGLNLNPDEVTFGTFHLQRLLNGGQVSHGKDNIDNRSPDRGHATDVIVCAWGWCWH